MKYRTLGKTGFQVSAISYGASPLGGGFGTIDESEGIRSVQYSLDNGINLFDTSPLYGITRSETILGKALNGVPRDSYYLCSKVGRYGPADFDFSVDTVTQSVESSLKRLGVDYLDIALCHDIEFVPVGPVFAETYPALIKLKDQGKIRALGVSGYPLKIYQLALAAIPLDVVLVYCHYNLIDTTLQSILPDLEAQNIGIISAAPMAMGLLTGQALPEWHPASNAIRTQCKLAWEYCKTHGANLQDLALQFATANERVHSTLIGMPTVDIVQQNLNVAFSPPDGDLLHAVQDILAKIKDKPWPSGLPENNG